MEERTQIGWFNLNEERVFRNTYECAAWYEDVIVPAGKYPVYVYGMTVDKDNQVGSRRGVGGVYVPMDGTIKSDYFASQYFGVPISDYDTLKNAGKPSSHSYFAYLYEVADNILTDPENPWELFPEYEARSIHFVSSIDGEEFDIGEIFRKEGACVNG